MIVDTRFNGWGPLCGQTGPLCCADSYYGCACLKQFGIWNVGQVNTSLGWLKFSP